MLKKIKKIKGVGIFKDFIAKSDLAEFVQFNLVYGWNGCGKTTLTRLLNCLSSKLAVPAFPLGEFEIVTHENGIIKHNNLGNYKTPCFVFNQQFIEDNIDWKKQGAKSIIVIAEDKIEDRKRFIEIRDKLLPLAEIMASSSQNVLLASEKERDEFLTSQARNVKQSFQLIDTSDKHYFNYDRRKLADFVSTNKPLITDPASILDEETIKALNQQVKPIQRDEILWTINAISAEKLREVEGRIAGLLKTSVVNKSIQRLQKNPEINSWVQDGVPLHKLFESKDCEFCGQALPHGRLLALESHFSKEYSELIEKLTKAKEWLDSLNVKNNMPDSSELYDEFQESYKNAAVEIRNKERLLEDYLLNLASIVTLKLNNPFDQSITVGDELDQHIESLVGALLMLTSIIQKHNAKTRNFENDLKAYKHTLELHYVASGLKEKKYFDLLDRVSKEQEAVNSNLGELKSFALEKEKLETSLANVEKGAEDFNGELHSFLGRKDISLAYDVQEKGYRIMRTGSEVAENLSEGEKMAIAFIYFITKLTENGNRIEDSLVIIDDPISSFDGNHLFHSLAFLKRKCGNAKQLFILTHNFQYFKLVRDWIMTKNHREVVKSRLFTIEVAKGSGRESGLFNAHQSLIKFGSEYQYLFNKLKDYQGQALLDVESAYQVANYSRKLLEGFFKFKHPKERVNFYQLIEAGCKKGGIEKDVMEKVYKFINKYSHNEAIDFHDSPVDNLLGEGDNITDSVLGIIKSCDETHYEELVELCYVA